MNTPPPSIRARLAFGIDENAGVPIIVKATSRGNRLNFVPADLRDAAAPPPRSVVAGCLLQKESFTRWLTAPIRAARKAATVFHSLLDIQLPFSIEECEIALLGMAPAPDMAGTKGLVAGARQADIARRLEALAALSIHPHLLDQEGIALWSRAAAEFPDKKPASAARIVVYAGSDRVTLVVGQGTEFLAAHTLRQMDPDAVSRLLKSLFPTPPETTEWLWAGPSTGLADTLQACQAALSARWPGPVKTVQDPATFLARALAARALNPTSYPCNLRSGRFLHPELARRLERQPVRLAAACLAAALLLCLVNLTWQWAAQYRLTQGQQIIRTLAAGITGTSSGLPRGQETLAAKRFSEAQARGMEPFLAATEATLPATLGNILEAARKEEVSIEVLTLGSKGGVIHGYARNFARVEALAGCLDGKGWKTTLEHKEPAPGDERVAFVIGMKHAHAKE